METLSKLFGSELRVKMLRLFLFNPGGSFDIDYINDKAQTKIKDTRKELDFLKKTGVVRVSGKKKIKTFSLNPKFEFIIPLTDFLVNTHSVGHKNLLKKLEKAGKIKVVLLAGVFIQDPESRLDILVVGDDIKQSAVDKIVKNIESNMGKDISYSILSVADFMYRISMNDKLIRDIIDFPHDVIVDKIGVFKTNQVV